MKFKSVLWRSPVVPRHFYLFRVMWNWDEVSHKFSISLRSKLFGLAREWRSVEVTLLGVRFHHVSSRGGRYV